MPPSAAQNDAETYLAEDAVLVAARHRAAEVGVACIGSAGGAALRLLAAAVDARAVVEIGTGTGVSSVWLLRGMHSEGVLTTIDTEAEHQRLAREAFTEAGVGGARTRTITGRAMDVLPRLADASYDLVFCSALRAEYADYLGEALRLLRPGGVVVFDVTASGGPPPAGRVADAATREQAAGALAELTGSVRDNDRLISALLPAGEGLLVAVLRG